MENGSNFIRDPVVPRWTQHLPTAQKSVEHSLFQRQRGPRRATVWFALILDLSSSLEVEVNPDSKGGEEATV